MPNTLKQTPEQIAESLAQHTGSGRHRYNEMSKARGVVYTDGAKELFDACGAWWFFDVVLSHQAQCRNDAHLSEFQFWTIKCEANEALITCDRDEGDTALSQSVGWTDFPLPEARLWLVRGLTNIDGQTRSVMVAMLPSEY